MTDVKSLSTKYRYVIAGLILVVPLCTLLPYLAVSVLMNDIMISLNIDYSLAGMMMSIMMAICGVCMFFGSTVQDRIGLRQTVILAIILLSTGSAICFFAKGFASLFTGRVVLGIGFGLNAVSLSPFMSTWFTGKQRTLMISANLVANSLAAVASYSLANPIKNMIGSWNGVFGVYSLFILAIALVWIVFSKSNTAIEGQRKYDRKSSIIKKNNSLLQAMRIRQYWVFMFMGIFMHAAMTSVTLYLPSYLSTVRGLSIGMAAAASSTISVANIVGATLGGAVVARTGRRKVFIHLGLLLYILGGFLITLAESAPTVFISSALVGFSFMFILPSQSTISMETIRPFRPTVYAAAIALSSGVVQISSISIAPLFTSVSNVFGMTGSLRIFFLLPIVSFITSFLLKETGPKAELKTNLPIMEEIST